VPSTSQSGSPVFLDCSTLKMKALQFHDSMAFHPTDLDIQQHCCEILKSCKCDISLKVYDKTVL